MPAAQNLFERLIENDFHNQLKGIDDKFLDFYRRILNDKKSSLLLFANAIVSLIGQFLQNGKSAESEQVKKEQVKEEQVNDPFVFNLKVIAKILSLLAVAENLNDHKLLKKFIPIFVDYFTQVFTARIQELNSVIYLINETNENQQDDTTTSFKKRIQRRINVLKKTYERIAKTCDDISSGEEQKIIQDSIEETCKTMGKLEKSINNIFLGDKDKIKADKKNEKLIKSLVDHGLDIVINISQEDFENKQNLIRAKNKLEELQKIKNLLITDPLNNLDAVLDTQEKIEKLEKYIKDTAHEITLQRIQYGMTIFSFAGDVAVSQGIITPKTNQAIKKCIIGAQHVASIVNTVINYTAIATLSGPLAPPLLVLKGVWDIYKLFSDDEKELSENEKILNSVVIISQQVKQMHQMMNVRFDRLENTLQQMHVQTHQRFDRLEEIQEKIYQQTMKCFHALAVSQGEIQKEVQQVKQLLLEIGECEKTHRKTLEGYLEEIFSQGYKYAVFESESLPFVMMTRKKFIEYVINFEMGILKIFKNPLKAGGNLRIAQDIAAAITSNERGGIANNINNLTQYMQQFSSKQITFNSQQLPNPSMWAEATSAMLHFIYKFSHFAIAFQQKDKTQRLKFNEIIEAGNSLREFIFQVKTSDKLFMHLFDEYTKAANKVKEEIKNIILRDALGISNDLTNSNEKNDDLLDKLKRKICPLYKQKEDCELALKENEKKLVDLDKQLNELYEDIKKAQLNADKRANETYNAEIFFSGSGALKNEAVDIQKELFNKETWMSIAKSWAGADAVEKIAQKTTSGFSFAKKTQDCFTKIFQYLDLNEAKLHLVGLENDAQRLSIKMQEQEKKRKCLQRQIKKIKRKIVAFESRKDFADSIIADYVFDKSFQGDGSKQNPFVNKNNNGKSQELTRKILSFLTKDEHLKQAVEQLNTVYVLLDSFIALGFAQDYLYDPVLRDYLFHRIFSGATLKGYLENGAKDTDKLEYFIYTKLSKNLPEDINKFRSLLLQKIVKVAHDREHNRVIFTGNSSLDAAFDQMINFRTLIAVPEDSFPSCFTEYVQMRRFLQQNIQGNQSPLNFSNNYTDGNYFYMEGGTGNAQDDNESNTFSSNTFENGASNIFTDNVFTDEKTEQQKNQQSEQQKTEEKNNEKTEKEFINKGGENFKNSKEKNNSKRKRSDKNGDESDSDDERDHGKNYKHVHDHKKNKKNDNYSNINGCNYPGSYFFNPFNKSYKSFSNEWYNHSKWYDSSKISKLLEAKVQACGGYKTIGGEKCQYLLDKPSKFCPDDIQEKEIQEKDLQNNCYVMVTPALNNFEKTLPITYFLNKEEQPINNPTIKMLDKIVNSSEKENYLIQLQKIYKNSDDNKKQLAMKLKEILGTNDDGFVDIIADDLLKGNFETDKLRKTIKNKQVQDEKQRKDVFDDLEKLFTNDDKAKGSCNVRILTPFNISQSHWCSLEIVLQKKVANSSVTNPVTSYNVTVYRHDPYGGKEQKLEQKSFDQVVDAIRTRLLAIDKSLTEKSVMTHSNEASPYVTSRQAKGDGDSCGVIVVEDIGNRMQGNDLPNSAYPLGTTELRKGHDTLIDDDALIDDEYLVGGY